MSNINDFKQKLRGGGARANQFEVEMFFPTWVTAQLGQNAGDNFKFLCTGTSTPGSTVGEVAVPFRGRNLYVAGDRTFETWSTTILNDTDFLIYRGVEIWLDGMNDVVDNTSTRLDPDSYQQNADVKHLDRNNVALKTWHLKGVMPTTLPGITLSYGDNDTVESFDVTWRYLWYETDSTLGTTYTIPGGQ